MREVDLVVVGGGIGGSALAAVMARAGASVLVLERQERYRDHVRGEIVWQWGVRVARSLGLEDALLAGGGEVVRWIEAFDEGDEPAREDGGEVIAGVAGSLNVAHPAACEALAAAARGAGADVRMGVRDVQVSAGAVRWKGADDDACEVRAGLVAGADGRRSSVRAQPGLEHAADASEHLIAGLLVDGARMDANTFAREGDLLFMAFPQGGGRARFYLCFPAEQRTRFAGADGSERFLSACALGCLGRPEGWGDARPAGPCATFTAEHTRAEPFGAGVVLVGDAAGYENPLMGQGLSMALQDVADVTRALLAGEPFDAYAEARATRQRLANLAATVEIWANDGFALQDPAARVARYEHIRGDAVLAALEESFWAGFDDLPQDLARGEVEARLAL